MDIDEFWSTNLSGVRDLSATGGQRSMGLGLVYEDECLTFETSLSRMFYQDRDLRPTDAIMFRLALKNLGDVGTGFSP